MKEFYRRLTQERRLAIEVLVVSLMINMLGLVSSLYSIQVLNRYLALGIDETLITLTFGALIAIGLEVFLRGARHNVVKWLCRKSDKQMAEVAMHAITTSRYMPFENLPAEARREALSGLNTVQMSFGPQNLLSLVDGPFGLIFVLFVFLLSPTIGVGVLLLILIIAALTWLLYNAIDDPSKGLIKSVVSWGRLQNGLCSSSELTRAFPAQQLISTKWDDNVQEVTRFRGMVAGLQGHIGTIGVISAALGSIVIFGLGSREVLAGNLDVGSLIGASILGSRAIGQLNRVMQLIEPVKRGLRSLELLGQLARLPRQSEEGMSLTHVQGHIAFEDLAFAYAGQPVPLFESLDFSQPPGTVLVFKGGNGAGKTTFARLLSGLLEPARGRIKIDDMDLRQASQLWWSRQLSYFPQEPAFLDGSLRENLTMGSDIDDVRLVEVMQEVGLGTFLQNSKEGLSMPLYANGASLSMGVRRRITLARALLIDGQVVIFDDPTEALDSQGCIAIANILNRLVKAGKTVIVMTNEPFIIKAANFMIDLDKKPQPTVIHADQLNPEAE
ncbi:ATP-binding cassette domain-containing protein [Amphritea sp. 1_MG-2023]|uniref:ATP-binding cassette domain-containing protein n=1 Tax=Amphritea sp. 1_MG-2023 TaxID=3062670 RepID=UPI0026E337CC|nr:ATP-binding cassette domain-containing protein [Amphritea sp. 1_MG-2023]MDO6563722.1 ATP-binding cassette domain-containing protein [Amphritea sp. 1_MG-2023]